MKPIEKIIRAFNPELCPFCKVNSGNFPGKAVCHHSKQYPIRDSVADEPCTKEDWDGCPYNK
jgi:hypothetical protein